MKRINSISVFLRSLPIEFKNRTPEITSGKADNTGRHKSFNVKKPPPTELKYECFFQPRQAVPLFWCDSKGVLELLIPTKEHLLTLKKATPQSQATAHRRITNEDNPSCKRNEKKVNLLDHNGWLLAVAGTGGPTCNNFPNRALSHSDEGSGLPA